MRIGDKNLEQFEKEFDKFLDSFSDEKLLKALSKYLISNQTYYIKKDVISSKNKDENHYSKTICKELKTNKIEPNIYTSRNIIISYDVTRDWGIGA